MKIKLLVIFLVTMIFAGCEYEDGDINYNMGNDFIDDPTTVYMIDDLDVNTFTTTVDSFVTSRTDRLLSGRVVNKYGMETYCETYFTFDPTDVISFHESAVYDSVCFHISLDGYNYGDTTQPGLFEVFMLTEKIEPDDVTGYIYNTRTLACEQESLGQFVVDYNDDEKDLVMRLPDEMGLRLYNMVKNESDTLSEKDLFNDYLKGFVIKPVDDQTSFVAGFFAVTDSSNAPTIKVYYHDLSTIDDLSIDFPLEDFSRISSSSADYLNYHSFNHIENRYDGTVLEGIQPGEEKLSSKLTENVTFLQTSSMLRTRIEIPQIDNLYELGTGAIIKAELYMEPEAGTYNEKADLPSQLKMLLVDEKNSYFNELYITGTDEVEVGNLNFNDEFKKETNYTFDITYFVKTEYEDVGDPKYSLMMYLPYESRLPSIDQLIVGNSENVANKMKLKIYVTKF